MLGQLGGHGMNSGRTIFAQLLDYLPYTILQILSVSLFEKTPILRALSNPPRQFGEAVDHNQLELFNI